MGLDMYIEVDGSQVIYMRKANAIRKWFADNLDNFIDNGTTNIPKEKFKAIIDIMFDTIELGGIFNIYNRYVKNNCECKNERYNLFDDCEKFVENGGEKYKLFCETAQKLFPTSDGFFFGSTDYDDWYIYQLISNYCKFKQLYMDLTNDDKNDWRKGSVRYYEWY